MHTQSKAVHVSFWFLLPNSSLGGQGTGYMFNRKESSSFFDVFLVFNCFTFISFLKSNMRTTKTDYVFTFTQTWCRMSYFIQRLCPNPSAIWRWYNLTCDKQGPIHPKKSYWNVISRQFSCIDWIEFRKILNCTDLFFRENYLQLKLQFKKKITFAVNETWLIIISQQNISCPNLFIH